MRVDSTLRDISFSVKQLLLALDNRLTVEENLAPEGEAGQILTSRGANLPPHWQSVESVFTAGVSSVFGRTGDVTAQMGDYQFNQITAKPTTISGYGITDAYTKTEVDVLLAALSLDDLDDVVITTPVVKEVLRHNGTNWVNAQLAFSDLSGSIADGQVPESAVTQHEAALSIGWSQLTSVPTTLAGYGITDAYTKSATDTLLAAKADSATTLAGYGITDAYTKSAVDALLAALTTGDLTDWPADASGVLTNDGAGTLTWEAAGSGGDLDDLGDVVITSATAKDLLAFDGTDWVNQAIDASYVGAGTFGSGTYVFDSNALVDVLSTSTDPIPVKILGYATGDAWVGAIGFYDDAAATRYGYVGKGSVSDADMWLTANVGNIKLFAPAVLPQASVSQDFGSDTLWWENAYVKQHFVGDATGQSLANLAKELIHFDGHQTSDAVQGISWSWGSAPANAQAKVIVQMSGAYGSKMYFMTTNSFATGAQTAMLIDHLGVISINRSTGKLIPATDGVQALGDSSHLWDAVYSEKYFGKNNIVCGSGTINSATATLTINCTAVTANSCIFLQITDLTTSPTTVLKVTAKIVGTSFTVWRDLSVSTNSVSFRWFLIDSV